VSEFAGVPIHSKPRRSTENVVLDFLPLDQIFNHPVQRLVGVEHVRHELLLVQPVILRHKIFELLVATTHSYHRDVPS